ncbi:MAG: ABC transporter ATP-binding protein, partial [Verrucomicrobiia bacterium]
LNAEMTTVVQENIAGVRVVKGFAMEHDEIAKFHRKKEDFLGSLLSTVRFWAVRVPLAQFVYGLSVPLALWVGGQAVIRESLSLGALVTVIFLLMGLGWRIAMIGQFTNIIQTASASAERILGIIDEEPAITSGSRPFPPGGGAVEFENVSFSYGPGSPVLHNISFKVRPGERIAVVGPTGAGKSSLLGLIPRFHDPTSGRLLIDGVDVRELDLKSLRRNVGVIFQETFLFAMTVAENIAYGDPGASRERIIHAAQLACAHEFIEQLPDGYDTVIGERGVSLSGGQRQRIAIARALLLNPRILILDDATAAVDALTERAIRDAIERASVGRTVFIIAQRLATVRQTDRILVMNEGTIVAIGSHDELLRQEGFYRTIAQDFLSDAPGRVA